VYGGDRAGAADVHASQLPVGQEELRAQLVERGQLKRCSGGRGATEHDPVVVGVAGSDFTWGEEVLDEVVRAQFGGVEGGELLWAGRIAMVHEGLRVPG
jgi:hypothetical protein